MTGPSTPSTLKRVSRGAGVLAASNLLSAVLSFVLSVLIGRGLGVAGLGTYSAVLAWIFPAVLFAEFGVNTLITREAAQNLPEAAHILRATAPVRLLLGSAGMVILVLFAPFLSQQPEVVLGIQVSSPFLLITPVFGAYTAVLRAQGRMAAILLLNVGMLASQVALSLFILSVGCGLAALLVVNVLTSAGQAVAAWVLFRSAGTRRTDHLDRAAWSGYRVLQRAWPFAAAGVLAAVQSRVALLALERLASSSEIGAYAAASRFVEAARMLPMAFSGALFPALAALAADLPALKSTFRQALTGYVGYGTAAAIGLSVFAAPLLILTYGTAFVTAGPVLQVLGWALVPSLARSALTLYAYAQGQEGYNNRVTLVLLVVQLAGAWLLIPAFQAQGAALALFLAESIGCVLLLIGLRQ